MRRQAIPTAECSDPGHTELREIIVLEENRRFADSETGPLFRSFFPKARLLVYLNGELLGRESTREKEERLSVKPSATLQLIFDDQTTRVRFQGDEAVCETEKNALKRTIYRIVSGNTKRTLPWGSTTGIRPTKEALMMLSAGRSADEIRKLYRDKYLTSEEKIDESIEIAENEKRILKAFPATKEMDPRFSMQTNGYCLYIGILFCPSICLYCSFSSHRIDSCRDMVRPYIASLKKEIDFVAERFRDRRLDCIYFGGGTPTTLSAEELSDILSYIEKRIDLSHLAEITVEAGRPDSISEDKLAVMREHGVTRISVNPQTMNDRTLQLIGRRHSVSDTIKAYNLVRKYGFESVNMDIILGLPGENADDISHTLSEIRKLSPDNLTIHSLALKTAARLRLEWDKYEEFDFVNSTEIMDMALSAGRELGMKAYYLYRQKNMAANLENVGMSIPGKEGIYNVLIMEEREDIVAIGAGAASKKVRPDGEGGWQISRCENVKDIRTYIDRIDQMIERKDKLFTKSEL